MWEKDLSGLWLARSCLRPESAPLSKVGLFQNFRIKPTNKRVEQG